SQSEADQLAKIVATPQRSLNPAIVGKSVEVITKMAGISVPPGTRCLLADVGGVGRDFPLSMEKLSPILAFYVEDGLERGAARCNEILHYGGMGHTAGIHTRSREAAIRYGAEMPASRITVNTPTTHGAIGISTALPPLGRRPPQTTEQSANAAGNGGANKSQARRPRATPASSNGHATAEFVSEDDVKRAIRKGEKIYVRPKSIITRSARDIAEPAEV